jgi:hypothetical protein
MGGVGWSANETEAAQGVGTFYFSVSVASRKATVPSPNSTTISKHSQLSATHIFLVLSFIFFQLSRRRDTSEVLFFINTIFCFNLPTDLSHL